MDIRVSGHQVETGDALKDHVEERMTAIADKYFARAISAKVTFGKGPHDHGFRCAIVAHVMQGVILKGEAASQGDAHAAFEEAAGHVEKQLRRHMDRLKDHHKHANGEMPPELPESSAGYTVFQGGDEVEDVPDNPPIIAETSVDVPDASVSNAVWMLDLRNTNALLFKNSDTGVYNMVYRRRDGSIGWVEPDRAN
ncbi:ribosome-associated translation inhibitor RaiA [Parasphingopyxis algicola]|uniref:ribosome hibernation-promoting factor, HPF/YfiA family n=1 Tax=Parasphingopyxis algicola TaxID=2026624 RepID=UPI0015A23D26|nr:ribosome-associated translation inhibitor RaiA [Parasphingopyxis algicola]QLC25633.1 ribosome-associated translation inhibitor RaiA [Parasphingopyxis algicola]